MASYSLGSRFVMSQDFCVFSSHIQKEIVLYVLILNKPKTQDRPRMISLLMLYFMNLTICEAGIKVW